MVNAGVLMADAGIDDLHDGCSKVSSIGRGANLVTHHVDALPAGRQGFFFLHQPEHGLYKIIFKGRI